MEFLTELEVTEAYEQNWRLLQAHEKEVERIEKALRRRCNNDPEHLDAQSQRLNVLKLELIPRTLAKLQRLTTV